MTKLTTLLLYAYIEAHKEFYSTIYSIKPQKKLGRYPMFVTLDARMFLYVCARINSNLQDNPR